MSPQLHSSDKSISDKSKDFDIKPVYIPQDVMALLEDGEVSTSECLLLGVIHGYVVVRGEGCWATNATLGKRLGGISKNHISVMISKLIEKKLIIHTGWMDKSDGSKIRVLETCWSRIDLSKKNEGGISKNRKGGMGKSLSPPIGKSLPSIREEYKEGEGTNNSPTARLRSAPSQVKSTGPGKKITPSHKASLASGSLKAEEDVSRDSDTLSHESKDDAAAPAGYVAAAKKLREALRSNARRPSGYMKAEWEDSLRLLAERDGEEDWYEVLEFYTANCKRETVDKLGLPTIRNCKQFRTQFHWIRDKMRKNKGRSTPQNEKRYLRVKGRNVAVALDHPDYAAAVPLAPKESHIGDRVRLVYPDNPDYDNTYGQADYADDFDAEDYA